MKNKGFTLMELLIVIGVLGILAAGLLAAIDPFEQLKKARDSNYRSGAIELLQSVQRYYSNHGYFPWRAKGSACETSTKNWLEPANATSLSAQVLRVGANQDSEIDPCLNDLVADGELKTTFSQGLNTTVYISSWTSTNARVCFSPESKSNRNDAGTNLHIEGTSPNQTVAIGCSTDQKDAGECLQCFQ